MEIKRKPNNCFVKTPCTACGIWDRPGEWAYFIDGDYGEWICDDCVLAGEEHIRAKFLERAASFQRTAEAYKEAAEEEDIALPSEQELAHLRIEHAQEEAAFEAHFRSRAAAPLAPGKYPDVEEIIAGLEEELGEE